jgi:DNA-binding MarR family transcriptional regulator
VLGDDLPLWELVQTYHVVARGFTEVFAAAGLSATQFGILAHLAEGTELSRSELARRVLVRSQSIGELIAGLLERGLVEREGPGGRGRRAGLRLTADGRRLFERTAPAVHAFTAPAAIGLDAVDAAALTRMLRTVRWALTDGDAG